MLKMSEYSSSHASCHRNKASRIPLSDTSKLDASLTATPPKTQVKFSAGDERKSSIIVPCCWSTGRWALEDTAITAAPTTTYTLTVTRTSTQTWAAGEEATNTSRDDATGRPLPSTTTTSADDSDEEEDSDNTTRSTTAAEEDGEFVFGIFHAVSLLP